MCKREASGLGSMAIVAAVAADDCSCRRQQSTATEHGYTAGLRGLGFFLDLALFFPGVCTRLPHAMAHDVCCDLAVVQMDRLADLEIIQRSLPWFVFHEKQAVLGDGQGQRSLFLVLD